MFSDLDYKKVLSIKERIQWKYILVFVVCLIPVSWILYAQVPWVPSPLPQDTDAAAHVPAAPAAEVPAPAADAKPPNGTQPATSVLDDEQAEPIAICVSVKDQPIDMIEFFVHHYHNMGIRRFYVMDDGSDPPLSTFKYPGIPRSALTFTYEPRTERADFMQTVFYQWCIDRYREKHTWIAFIDTDEFLWTSEKETLGEVLSTFEGDDSVGALGVKYVRSRHSRRKGNPTLCLWTGDSRLTFFSWQMHSSSGLLYRPISVRRSFTTCIWDDEVGGGPGSHNRHVKSIVKMSHALGPSNPHKFNLIPGANTVGEDGDVVTTIAFREPITRRRIGLHHYAVKSKEEYEAKMARGNGMSQPKSLAFWRSVEDEMPHVNCTEMVAYQP